MANAKDNLKKTIAALAIGATIGGGAGVAIDKAPVEEVTVVQSEIEQTLGIPHESTDVKSEIDAITDSKKRSSIKAYRIIQKASESLTLPYKFTSDYGQDIQVVRIAYADDGERNGHIQYFVRAWNSQGDPIGFGKDGRIETERIRVFNPPILVPDGTYHTETNQFGEQIQVPNYKEDRLEAFRKDIGHTVFTIAKDGKNIVYGTVGNTVSTFYPANDGEADRSSVTEDWSVIRGGNGNANDNTATQAIVQINSSATTNKWSSFTRFFLKWDTSAIGSDVVSSATVSFYGDGNVPTVDFGATALHIAGSTTGTGNIVNADYQTAENTTYGNIASGSWNTGAYNDITVNASGIADIQTAGTTVYSTRTAEDITNSEPTWQSDKKSRFTFYSVNRTGTANDPKLVVTHAAPKNRAKSLMILQ